MNNLLIERLEGLKSESELKNAVIDIALDHIEEYDNGEKYFEDILDHGCASGIVSELIYYYQTEEFFNNYSNEIFELYNDIKNEYGEIDMELNKNNLSWFAFEETIRNLYFMITEDF